mmetsp:Transcript_9558/g.15889  ORF Transcript_9558/g.15889 Transcript_9558/m.15889 type:complete len:188 (+) Transcript_9558:28-591(+)
MLTRAWRGDVYSTVVLAILCLSFIVSTEATIAPTVAAQCIFKTSSSTYSGTSDSIYGSFIGDFATSGPHDLGSFDEGSKITLDVTLHKVIGNLNSVLLFTNGTDGWLLSEGSTCEIDGRVFALEGRRQWLDGLDLELLQQYGDGNEPFAQEDTRTLPSSPTLMLSVVNSWLSLNSQDGVFKPPIPSS